MAATIASRDYFEVNKTKMDAKKAKNEGDIEKINSGQKTLGTITKSEKDTMELADKADRAGTDSKDLDTLLKIINIHLGMTVIPKFKKEKLVIYH